MTVSWKTIIISTVSNVIEDYRNEKLDRLLKKFFKENEIDNFIIEDIKVNISGNFIIHKNIYH